MTHKHHKSEENGVREISCAAVTETVARLCCEANVELPDDFRQVMAEALDREISPVGKETLQILLDNMEIARKEKLPLCQDTGISVVFIEMGQDIHITGGSLNEAIHEGVRQGYRNGNLRKSVVGDPLFDRINTRDNTPAVIHVSVTDGNALKITVCPRGGGGENMSALAMLNPSDGVQGVVDFVVTTVEKSGANACPPMVVGVGVGGTSEMALLLAKKASLRPMSSRNRDARVADLEERLLHRINALGIGPEGFGGIITALDVHIETYPCHISGLPVGVSLQCHAARHKEAVL